MALLSALLESWRTQEIPKGLSSSTRHLYDLAARVYPLSSMLFHSAAHQLAVDLSDLKDGSKVLELAVGSGEMMCKIAARNPAGFNVGMDLSPQMAIATDRRLRKEHLETKCAIGASDCRNIPFKNSCFETVFCCLVLELLSQDEIMRTLHEARRVLKPGGVFTLIVLGADRDYFNAYYRVASRLAPSLLGRQLGPAEMELLGEAGFQIEKSASVVQRGYPTRVVISRMT